jgi:hypothetical protein
LNKKILYTRIGCSFQHLNLKQSMRKLFLFSTALLASFFLSVASQGQVASSVIPPVPTPAPTGVRLTVNTADSEFTPLIGVLIGPGGTTSPLPPQGFNATVVLANHTSHDITFTLGVFTVAKEGPFRFQVYNDQNKIVWDSWGGHAVPQAVMLKQLKPGDSLRGTAFVPLFPKGVALPAGHYVLDVILNGTPRYSASMSFDVNNVIAIN